MMRFSNRISNRRQAATIVEFAFIVPVLFMVLLGIFEFARFLFVVQLVNNAAREGARFAVVNSTTTTTSDLQTYVDGYLVGQGSQQLVGYTAANNITIYLADPTTGTNSSSSWQTATWGDAIGVSVTGTYKPITPGLLRLSDNLTITGTCVMTCEAN